MHLPSNTCSKKTSIWTGHNRDIYHITVHFWLYGKMEYNIYGHQTQKECTSQCGTNIFNERE